MTSDYVKETADEICDLLVEGKSLAEICRMNGMPKVRTVYRWLANVPDFVLDYTRAREAQAHTDADAISDIAARVLSGEFDPASARAAIDAYKWTAGKRLPKVYGEKLELGGAGPKGEIVFTIRDMTKDA